ncbi:hypothetical protein [Roseateles sp. P5_E11]
MSETKSTCPYCGVGCGYARKRDPHCGDTAHSPLIPSPSEGLHSRGRV